jgi:hypothetical protein
MSQTSTNNGGPAGGAVKCVGPVAKPNPLLDTKSFSTLCQAFPGSFTMCRHVRIVMLLC